MDTMRCSMKKVIITMAVLGSSLPALASKSIVDNVALSNVNQTVRVTNIESKNKDIMADYSQYIALTRQHTKSDQQALNQHFVQYRKQK